MGSLQQRDHQRDIPPFAEIKQVLKEKEGALSRRGRGHILGLVQCQQQRRGHRADSDVEHVIYVLFEQNYFLFLMYKLRKDRLCDLHCFNCLNHSLLIRKRRSFQFALLY